MITFKNLVQEEIKLQKAKEAILDNIEKCHGEFLRRYEEIRRRYRKVLDELRTEFNNSYIFYGYESTSACWEIISIKDFNDYFEINIKNDFGNDSHSFESAKIPYDSKDEDRFIQEFKDQKRKEYREKLHADEDEKYKQYLNLKKRFEK